MKKTIIIGIVFIFILAVGGVFLLNRQPKSADESLLQMQSEKSHTIDTSHPRYVVYSKEAFMGASKERRVLFFYANWCPTCRPADENFSTNSARIPDDLTLFRVNYNDTDTDQSEKELAKTYRVTYQHTFVQIDRNGNEVTRWNGGQIDNLLENIK